MELDMKTLSDESRVMAFRGRMSARFRIVLERNSAEQCQQIYITGKQFIYNKSRFRTDKRKLQLH
jgi:hypothetical protein